jgi:hypothetical protein
LANIQESDGQALSRPHRGEHMAMWGFLIAILVFIATGAVIGKSVMENSHEPVSAGVQSLSR